MTLCNLHARKRPQSLMVFKCRQQCEYLEVRSDGPPVRHFGPLFCPLFDFDTDKDGVQMIDQLGHNIFFFASKKTGKGPMVHRSKQYGIAY